MLDYFLIMWLNAGYDPGIHPLRVTAGTTTVLEFTYCLKVNLIPSESHEFPA